MNNKPPTQKVVFTPIAHEEILKGATVLADAVRSTMGPGGHSVIIDMETGPPLITKDGVTVAKSINLKNRLHSMGAELLKEVASKTNDLAGDGTTSSVVLGHALLSEGIKLIGSGRSPIFLKKGMDIACEDIITFLKDNCTADVTSSEDIVNVGTISANGDRSIGELLAKAIEKVGHDGIITIEPAKSIHTSLEVVEGMQLDTGYVSPFFVTNSDKATCELDNPLVLLTPNKISSIQDLISILEPVAKNNRSLLIIADDVEGDALHTLIVNKTKNVLKVCAVKAPSYGEHRADILSDLQTVVGGNIFGATSNIALKNATQDMLGNAKKVIVGRNFTTIIGENTEERKNLIQERVTSLRNLLSEDKTLDALHIDKYRRRLARLSGGIAVIKVGGSTEVEILEKKDRVEDAVNATLAAAQEGIVPGGGTALMYASMHLRSLLKGGAYSQLPEDAIAGINIVINACEAPMRTIIENTGCSSEVIIQKLKDKTSSRKAFYLNMDTINSAEDVESVIQDLKEMIAVKGLTTEPSRLAIEEERVRNLRQYFFGYNAAKGEFEDLVESGVIDPIKVTRCALGHATSVVGLLLTCNAVIVNEDEETEKT